LKRHPIGLLVLLFLATSACGAFNVEMVYRTPIITPTATPLAVTETPMSPTATQISFGPTQASPNDVPTSAAPIPLSFANGSTNANVQGRFEKYTRVIYEIKLSANQFLAATISSATQKVSIEIDDPTGKLLIKASQNLKSWQGYVAASGIYHISVVSRDDASKYYLQVIIPTRINIPSGSSNSISDKLPPGGLVNYVLYATNGQTMTIKVNAPGSDVFLEVSGMSNGQTYLRSVMHESSFTLKVPATQDYAINLISTRTTSESITTLFNLK